MRPALCSYPWFLAPSRFVTDCPILISAPDELSLIFLAGELIIEAESIGLACLGFLIRNELVALVRRAAGRDFCGLERLESDAADDENAPTVISHGILPATDAQREGVRQ
jgi:hypothetical protein